MVRVKQGNLNVTARRQLKSCRGFQGQRLEQVLQMLVRLHACLEDAFGVVDTTRVSLETEEHLPCGCRTIDERGAQALKPCKVVAVNMAEEAREWWTSINMFPEEVDCNTISCLRTKVGGGGSRAAIMA